MSSRWLARHAYKQHAAASEIMVSIRESSGWWYTSSPEYEQAAIFWIAFTVSFFLVVSLII
jgi:hypothetical protein